MGVLRKALFLSTMGISGAVGIKTNSKKERIAKSLERQEGVATRSTPQERIAKFIERQEGAATFTAPKKRIAKSLERQERTAPQERIAHVNVLDDLVKATTLHDQGVLPDEQYEVIKKRLLAQLVDDKDSNAIAD